MNQLLISVHDLLKQGNFDYAICGGFALDLFADKQLRDHGDVDICVFEKDKDVIFQFMKVHHWEVYEFQGQGIVRAIADRQELQKGKNLMCLKSGCELVRFYPCERGEGYFYHEFIHLGIQELNYLEFLFNASMSQEFIFDGPLQVSREMDKAVLYNQDIPYLSPELVLLYKSRDAQREANQFDYEKTVPAMDREQLGWFLKSLDVLYPNGHKWKR